MTHWSRFDATADRRLLKRLADGGESAIAEVYDIYAERLYDYALLFTSDVHIARDIVHDALIDASRRAPRMRDRRHLRSWLYGAVRRRGMSRPRDAWSTPARTDTPPPATAGASDDRDAAGTPGDTAARLRVAHAALSALDRTHRDALCLALRHDMDGAALATTLGVSQRRARGRVNRAADRAEAAARAAETLPPLVTTDAAATGDPADASGGRAAVPGTRVHRGARRAGGGAGGDARVSGGVRTLAGASPSGGGMAGGASDDGPSGDERDGGEEPPRTAVEIARASAAVAPPDELRDRVQHTASDPQLARYRSQIVARGGRLVASGFPRQPDAPSQVARRYAVGGVAMVAFVAVMGVGLNMIGAPEGTPVIGGPVPSWTTGPGPASPTAPARTASPGASTPGNGDRGAVALPTGRSRPGATGGRHTAGPSHRAGERSPGPHRATGGARQPGTGERTDPPVSAAGNMSVRPAKIGFGATDSTASLVLTASDGPVTWSAHSASSVVSLSANQGTIDPGDSRRVTVRLARNAILQLPGKTTITVSGSGADHTVPVSWSISLLSR